MRLALFADIHGNREAFDACLDHAHRRGADRFGFMGDLVGYGADPGYIVDKVAEYCERGAFAILGNHDAAVLRENDNMNDYARAAIDWTREELDDLQKTFLERLPHTLEKEYVLFVHSDASAPADWNYITDEGAAEQSMHATPKPVTICGHVHVPQLYRQTGGGVTAGAVPRANEPIVFELESKSLAVLGSVGQPRDENPNAAYALYDDSEMSLTYVRVDYDIERAAQKIHAAGLPRLLAARLFIGR
ncbi:MAG: metallophosphoesterase family protein [Methylobacteriaceae bacterium]|nr:metallophosphoesterase family protein [Methylobacteriaceae bacterium]